MTEYRSRIAMRGSFLASPRKMKQEKPIVPMLGKVPDIVNERAKGE